MGIIRSLFILLAGAALATFLWSNYDQRVVVFFTRQFRTVELPLAAALVVALLTGLILAVALSLPNQFRLRGRIRELTRKIDRLENENAELRKLPLEDSLPESPPTFREPREVKSPRRDPALPSATKPPGA
ncbi:MAG: lipopolysaccharide assembly protein LapA domain-containing protein [Vicinamibacteria bacterium]